ncbi:MAG: hypothetical protein IJ156_03590 [Bacteroidales bacterium]|nr:hypothetical protein [Bacteroidales bacterium]
MRKTLTSLAAVMLTAAVVLSCGNRKNAKKQAAEAPAAEVSTEACLAAIDRYLDEQIAPQYSLAEFTIPYCDYIDEDWSNLEDILVWGNFWVLNYAQAGDTLKTVSGGNHPGKVHLKPTEDGRYEVTAFEQVGDGSEFLPTAKRIFGDRFEAFQAAYSNDEAREEVRREAIAAYVEAHGLPFKVYQDFGWPAVKIGKPSEAGK